MSPAHDFDPIDSQGSKRVYRAGRSRLDAPQRAAA